MSLQLRSRSTISLPSEFPNLIPNFVIGLSLAQIASSQGRIGRETVELGDFFKIQGDPNDGRIAIDGDLRLVQNLGAAMTHGSLLVDGNVGDRLGAGMIGGTIDVFGSAGDWAGVGMRGGLLRIGKNAGDHLGSSEPGEKIGMRDGNILVHGKCGDLSAERMRAGLIAVGGTIGADAARGMIAGSLFGFDSIGPRAGSGMKRGTIVTFKPGGIAPSPTFLLATRFRPPFAAVYLRHLRELGFHVPETLDHSTFLKYNGDRLVKGQGEILVLDNHP